uniref:Uncharacterized protein n=1 Tax=Arundo donax TaxID=35708 RepID=A0A0A9BCX5_ARUDO
MVFIEIRKMHSTIGSLSRYINFVRSQDEGSTLYKSAEQLIDPVFAQNMVQGKILCRSTMFNSCQVTKSLPMHSAKMCNQRQPLLDPVHRAISNARH